MFWRLLVSFKLVSVHLLVYNAERFIEEALDSILSQDYPNFEVIIGDDASTDGTVEILKRYHAQYPDRIKLLLNSVNMGVTNNCNKIPAL